MTVPFRYACGREFPEYVQANRHTLYTLICDCARVYTVSQVGKVGQVSQFVKWPQTQGPELVSAFSRS